MSIPPLAAPGGEVDFALWDAASAAVRAHCGWHIAPAVTETVTLDGSGGSVQMLPTLRLNELTSITNDGAAVTDPEWSRMGAVRGCWTDRYRGVVAVMNHGYDECPEDVLQVVRDLVKTAVLVGGSQFTAGPFSVTAGATSSASQGGAVGISEAQRSVLAKYRIPPRP